jgi:hypothetical protein
MVPNGKVLVHKCGSVNLWASRPMYQIAKLICGL